MSSVKNDVFSIEVIKTRNVPSPKKLLCSFRIGQHVKALMTSLIASIGTLTLGTILGYPSVAIENMNSNENIFHINDNQYSWFASLSNLISPLGCFFSSWIIDKHGRKRAFIAGTLPIIIGWFIIAGAQNVAMLYIGKIFTGAGYGVVVPAVQVYISEISTSKIRGQLCTLLEIAVNFGVLFTYVMATFLSWQWLAIACAMWPLLLLLCTVIILPESPRWLLYKGRREEAIKSLVWLRCVPDTQVSKEVTDIEDSLKNFTEVMPWSNYFRPPLLRYFALSMSLYIFYQFSGISVLRSYASQIFTEAGGVHLPNNVEIIIVGVLMFIGTVMCAFVVDRIERRTLLVLSASITCFSMFSLGSYFKVLDVDPIFATTNLSTWMPLLCMVIAMIGFNIGSGPLPHILNSECFSTRARARANSAGTAVLAFSGFIQVKFFPDISQALGLAGAFWLSAGICLLEAIVGFLAVPNKINNKTLEMIQQDLGQ